MPAMIGPAVAGVWVSMTGAAKVIGGVAGGTPDGQIFLKGLIGGGKLRTVIDRCYPLANIVEAHRLAEGGHKKGHVAMVVE
jgi:NADPH:quinone reductase-like Zn-dependent oxidoreductase